VSRRTARILTIAAISAVVLALGALLVANLRWIDVPVDPKFQGEARRNPLLACERLLTRLGLPAESRSRLGDLPGVDHVLVLRTSGRFLPRPFEQRLLEWVAAGGHLVVLFPSDVELREQIEDAVDEGRFELPVAREFDVQCILDDTVDQELVADFGQGELRLRLGGALAFEDSLGLADHVAGDPMEARLLSLVHELGRVTLVADDEWAGNAEIGEPEHDHARAMWQIAQLESGRAGAVLVYGEGAAGLITLIARHGWMIVASLAVFVAAYLWRVGSRFGPILPDLPRDRRDFSEHVIASGEFLWRAGARTALLAAGRDEVRRRLGWTRPHLASANADERNAALAEMSGLPPTRVVRALEMDGIHDASLFTEVARDLATLRKAL
jgi:hypothetical protein